MRAKGEQGPDEGVDRRMQSMGRQDSTSAGLANERTSDAHDLDALAFGVLQKKLYQLIGMDLSQYKPNQVKRLLDSVLRRYHLEDYGALVAELKKDPAMLEEVKGRMSINVSEFFRDPIRFDYLEAQVLPEILSNTKEPGIWSAGASVGCEAYSIAILLDEQGALKRSRILGTDIDKTCIARARRGDYWESEIRNLSSDRKARYLRWIQNPDPADIPLPKRQDRRGKPEPLYRVSDDLRKAVRFATEDLFQSQYRRKFDLIICRNVTIYFTETAKKALYRSLCRALRPDGYLFVGGTEIIFNAEELGLDNVAPFFYRLNENFESIK